MQQNQQGRRFENAQPQQTMYRFPQNQPSYAWQQPASRSGEAMNEDQETRYAATTPRKARRHHKKILTWWNLFAVIGIVSVFVQLARYVVIPLLVYLNVLAGGAL